MGPPVHLSWFRTELALACYYAHCHPWLRDSKGPGTAEAVLHVWGVSCHFVSILSSALWRNGHPSKMRIAHCNTYPMPGPGWPLSGPHAAHPEV